jgi:hypothetical protein
VEKERESLSGSQFLSRATTLAFLAILVLVAGIYYLTEWPHYIILEPPWPEHTFTNYEAKLTVEWYSGMPSYAASKDHVWRKQFIVGLNCCEELSNRESILSYLDVWLSNQGWQQWTEVGNPCAHLWESEWLDRGTDYRAYVRRGTTSLTNAPAVCVAVWPFNDEGAFYVLLAASDK